MSQQENPEQDKQDKQIEDLPTIESEEEDVKGGGMLLPAIQKVRES